MSRLLNKILTLIIASMVIVCLCAADDGDVQPPDYYDNAARAAQKQGDFMTMNALVDIGLKHYPEVSGLNELKGAYLLHRKDYEMARFYLFRAIQANDDNVAAKHMLVDVEERTHNYSSAICYVNELLEINPYWRSLWQRKIELYRKQGNHVQADHLLRRICQIYPDDEVLHEKLLTRVEDLYASQKSSGDRAEATASLRELIKLNPHNESYYLDLVNLLLQQGDTEEAIQVAGRGASKIPGSHLLIKKKVGILAEANRYAEAMTFVRERMAISASPWLKQLYSDLEEEQAREEARRDPYTLYGRIYGTRKSQEALDYLLNTSFSRGYDEDALYYIAEARKRKGDTPNLLYKEYLVHKRLGNRPEARQRIVRLHEMQPENQDFVAELAQWKFEEATTAMQTGNYADAIEPLTLIMNASTDEEIRLAAFNKLYTCYFELAKWPEALQAAEDLHARHPAAPGYVNKRAAIISAAGNPRAALAFVADTLAKTPADSLYRIPMLDAYEEVSIPYIKSLIEAGAAPAAYEETKRLLSFNPSSAEGLRYALTLTDILDMHEQYDSCVVRARTLYPDDVGFLLKQAAAYTRNRQFREAIDLVRPELDSLLVNPLLIGAHSENSEFLALDLIKKHETDSAMAVVDSALIRDALNRQLLYTKGLVFEAKHQYDSAYVYQSHFQPGTLEVADFKRHMAELQQKNSSNTIALEYIRGRYGSADIITSVATALYEHRTEKNAYGGHLNYAGREGADSGTDPDTQSPGGIGIQLAADYSHIFNEKWTGTASVGWANRYFPQISANLGATWLLPRDWSMNFSLGYRRIETFTKQFKWVDEEGAPNGGAWSFDYWDSDYSNLCSARVGATKELGEFTVGANADLFLLQKSIYVNLTLSGKYFPLSDRRTSVIATASAGTAPEANMIDNAMPGSFSKLNSSVGLGGTYMMNKNITLGLLGTWLTFYNQNNSRQGSKTSFSDNITFNYRNLYNISVQLYISF